MDKINDSVDTTTAQTSTENVKTIYLVRHAESEENRRISSLKNVGSSLYRLSLPSSNDITSSLHLLNIPAQVNSAVSEDGEAQISNVAKQLHQANFWKERDIQLLAHSPLQRARDTAAGFLLDPEVTNGDKATEEESKEAETARILSTSQTVPRVVEIEELLEKTPAEWIPGNLGSLKKRIKALETWLAQQPETNIVCVGHSQFFKAMLCLDFKFGNCDVWQVQLDTSRTAVPEKEETGQENPFPCLPPQWYDLQQLYKIKVDAETTPTE